MDLRYRLWWTMGSMAVLIAVVLTGVLYWLRPLNIESLGDMVLSGQRRDIPAIEYISKFRSTIEETGELYSPEYQSASTDGLDINVVVLDQTSDSAMGVEGSAASPDSYSESLIPVFGALAVESNSVKLEPVKKTEVGAQAAVLAGSNQNRLVARIEPLSSSTLYEFWVQVGSFVDRHRANDLDQRLGEQGIVSRISTSISGADTFFRVRIGPYGTRKGAEKFLSWIQKVDGLGGSYITKVDSVEE